jgi:predicted nucleotidyltransferase component of viral defense system
MTRKPTANIGASVRARLLNVTKERREDHTQTLVNYAAERFLYRLSKSRHRDQFVLKGAMLFAVRLGERYRPTRDLDLLGKGDPSEAVIHATIREIATTNVEDDGVVFDVDKLDVHAIREENKYGGMRAIMQAILDGARIHVQIDIGFGDALTPPATELNFPTLLRGMPSPNVLAYAIETIVAEKTHAMIEHGISNSRMRDFTDIAMAARRLVFHGDTLAAAMRDTFRRRGTPIPETEIVPLSDGFVQNRMAQATWKAFANRNPSMTFESLVQVVSELRPFLTPPLEHAQKQQPFGAMWEPGGPWK